MRPTGEVNVALLDAARRLATEDPAGRGPTLQEVATSAQVGYSTALHTVKNMTRAGALCITGRRKVPYRNKPVAEYKPADLAKPPPEQEQSLSLAESFGALANAWK